MGIKNCHHIVSEEEYRNRVQWKDLTQEEKDRCCKGSCGLNIFGYKILPDFIFKGCCCRHDFGYLRGGDARVKRLVDMAFKRQMYEEAQQHGNFITGPCYRTLAYLGANAVVIFGVLAWDYGPMKNKEEILAAADKK
jgi:hypothetical protein